MPELGTYGSMRGEAHKSLLYRDQISGVDNAPAEAVRADLAESNENMNVMIGLLAFFRLARRRMNVRVRHQPFAHKILPREVDDDMRALLAGQFVRQCHFELDRKLRVLALFPVLDLVP